MIQSLKNQQLPSDQELDSNPSPVVYSLGAGIYRNAGDKVHSFIVQSDTKSNRSFYYGHSLQGDVTPLIK